MKLTIVLLFSTVLFAAETTTSKLPLKSGDACVPPPGASAPPLPAKLLEGQGAVHFPITTKSAEAQKFFDQGVAQMHSFWAREAERSFLQAAQLDPEAPMPYWGIAMVAAGDYRPRFQLADDPTKRPVMPRVKEAVGKALEQSSLPGKATDIEKLYIASIAARRNEKAKDQDEAFVRGLRALVAKYPNEVEAKTYLALMIMRGFTLPEKKPKYATTTEAVTMLRQLLKDAPDHPGVHHYVIHGFEGSDFAKDAWPSCKRYAELVPNIPHALHMPGHIWAQTGRWDEAVQSFDTAAVNERGYMKADSLYGNLHHAHNVHFLATSYSFRGDYDKAIEFSKELMAMKENPREVKALENTRTAVAQGWFAAMGAMVQFRKWDDILSGKLPKPEKPRLQAWYHWARAIAHAEQVDAVAAKIEAAEMKTALQAHRKANKGKIRDEMKVAWDEVQGHISLAEKRVDKGLKQLASASARERRLVYTEPPPYPRPAAEALGHWAMRHGKSDVAEKAFKDALAQYPADHHAETALRALRDRPVPAGL
jgi:tetratricopeptide (TPR) repeat protein